MQTIGRLLKYFRNYRIAEGSIKAYFYSTLREIRQNEVDIDTSEGRVTIENDFVIAATGY
jgi:thioredoxin reductase (NADPH)